MHIPYDEMEKKGLYWHYTTWGGLSGIIENEKLWATNYAYLNDEQEVSYAFDLYSKATGQDQCGRVAEWRTSWPTWVTSVSERFNSLSQLRGYSGTGGYALGFTDAALNTVAAKHKGQFVKCLYEDADHQTLINSFAQKVLASAERARKAQSNPVNDIGKHHALRAAGYTRHYTPQELYRRAPELKHINFKDEAEWRIVCQGTFLEADVCPMAAQQLPPEAFSMIAPHIELRTAANRRHFGWPPVRNKALNRESVERFLTLKAERSGKKEFAKIPVCESNTPYRDW